MSKNNDSNNTTNFKKFCKEWVPYLIVIFLVILVKIYVVTPIRVNGSSMDDTLSDGDIMILNIIDYKFNDIKRFDIVVVDEEHEPLIKRVIGLPGESIEYKDNELYVNGKKIKDKFGTYETDDFYYNVPKEEYFVLGDNRTNSMDSRVFGSFKKKQIRGKTKLTIFPFSRFGNKE